MKTSFIAECVSYLYKKYDTEISNVKIVVPSRRASLFFNLELSRLISDKPVWQPKFYSIDNLIGELSDMVVAERLKLLVVLYNVYSKYHKELFDQFYYWGDMLLNDFEAIDNYMVDARLLFENSADIKDIELQFDFISDEDAEEIRRFWRHFGETRNSEEKEYFFNIWKTLYPIYNEFRTVLAKEGIGYRGMIARSVAEDLLKGTKKIDPTIHYAIIGFNALSSTEKVLFDALKGNDFLWDSDDSYVNSKNNEAGLFLRPNIEHYGESNSSVIKNNFRQPKNITVVKSPSASMECKYVWEFLEKCAEGGKVLGAETAIILTDESLLLPVLYSIPPSIAHFNVTAGYELRLTQAYSLAESIITLQTNYQGEFYYKDVESILSNPLVRIVLSDEQLKKSAKIIAEEKIYYSSDLLSVGDFLSVLFTKKNGWEEISDYFMFLFNRILSKLNSESAEVKEALFRAFNTIASLKILIADLNIELSDKLFLSLLRKHLKSERISFEGEPLIGIQIMGILESRTLDFENVLLLSVGEENFPSKSMGSSFIPSNLRHGYGLPTSNYHQAMYSYYFYRLLQRATRVDISYISMGNELSSGEPSRYIYQLIYAREHSIHQLELSLNITTSDTGDATVAKTGRSEEYIAGLKDGRRTLSATSLQNYIECPMRFYYNSVERVKTEDEEREKELDAIESGNVLHHSLETIYRPLVGLPHHLTVEKLTAITSDTIEKIVNRELTELLGTEEFDTTVKHSRRTLIKYIQTIIRYDCSRNDDFVIDALERPIEGIAGGVKFTGTIDRIDRLPSGISMIIDYKSGKGTISDTLFSLFDTAAKENNKPVAQSLLYALLYSTNHSVEVRPALYYVREMNKKNYSPLIKIKSTGEITRFGEVKEEFEAELVAKITELLDMETPFYKCDSENKCKYCNFYDLCAI